MSDETSDVVVDVIDNVALEAVTRAEVDIRVATAKRWPRSITAFQREAHEMATKDEGIAASTFYRLEREGKVIEGPSIRMAEIVACAFGSIESGSRIVSVDRVNKTLVAQGYCWDLEKNNRAVKEVTRRMSKRDGRVYSDDMIAVTGNAACSIALRNAVFTVVPRSLVDPILREAKQASLGKSLTMEQRRQRILSEFAKLGCTEVKVFVLAHVKGLADLGTDELIALRGLLTAIGDGETTLAQALAEATGQVEVETLKVTPKDVAQGATTAKDVDAPGKAQEPAQAPQQEAPASPAVPTPAKATAAAAPTEAAPTEDEARESFK